MRLSDRDCKTAWKAFFRAHCDELFQLSLLLTADPDKAAETLTTTLENINISVPPRTEDLALLQKTMAMKIVRDAADICTPRVSNASSMLQSGLRPLLQLERFPRACFVLRFLLGYATSSCAQMMGVEEAGVKALLQIGLIQFHRAVLGGNPERSNSVERGIDCADRMRATRTLNYLALPVNASHKASRRATQIAIDRGNASLRF